MVYPKTWQHINMHRNNTAPTHTLLLASNKECIRILFPTSLYFSEHGLYLEIIWKTCNYSLYDFTSCLLEAYFYYFFLFKTSYCSFKFPLCKQNTSASLRERSLIKVALIAPVKKNTGNNFDLLWKLWHRGNRIYCLINFSQNVLASSIAFSKPLPLSSSNLVVYRAPSSVALFHSSFLFCGRPEIFMGREQGDSKGNMGKLCSVREKSQ